MNVVTNQKIVKRYQTIGNFSLIGSLVIIGVGFYFLIKSNSMMWGLITMSASFILSQIGIFFGNRFGVHPQMHEQITQSLKGIENKNLLVHYEAVVPHLLVGPSGVWAIIAYPQRGSISYDEKKNRWTQKGVNLFTKLFMQEGLGRPDQEIKSYLKDIDKALKKTFADEEAPKAKAILVFTNPKIEISAENAPVPTLPIKKLKDFIRQQSKHTSLSDEQLTKLKAALPDPNDE
ncbi:MAG: hypothetical protein JEZ00_00065 [Anaerolineaceae bacterium]|nr:hypothetical protein [Anaerolineaceae bacterium]